MSSESLIKQLSQSFYKEDGTPNERLNKYCSKDIQKITIDTNTFTGYKTYSFFWEKTFVKEPERSSNGVINNLNSYATFITPHLQIKFALMSMEDYRRLYKLILSRNEFVVTCYDPTSESNSTTTNKMYFYPDSLPKLNMIARKMQSGEKWIELLGVQDYVIEMVGTNSQLGDLVVQYQPNVPSGVSSSLTGVAVNVANGQEILVGKGAEAIMNATFTNSEGVKYIFEKWNTIANPTEIDKGTSYAKDNTLVVSSNTTLYAQWVTTDTYTLSFDYGLGEPQVDEYGNAINSRQIKIGENFGTLYESTTPTVEFDGQKINNVYKWKGWYKFKEDLYAYNDKGELQYDSDGYVKYQTYNDEQGNKKEVGKLETNDKYNVNSNITIYQKFAPKSFTLTFDSNGGTQIDPITNIFNANIAIPIPKKDGKTFGGWHYDDKFTKKFGGTIPPKNATLYAKWE